jgi:hypothetical protein
MWVYVGPGSPHDERGCNVAQATLSWLPFPVTFGLNQLWLVQSGPVLTNGLVGHRRTPSVTVRNFGQRTGLTDWPHRSWRTRTALCVGPIRPWDGPTPLPP